MTLVEKVKIELCREGAVLPTYGSELAAGMDVYATEDVVIPAGHTAIIPLGIKMALPPGTECQVRDRSGIASSTRLRVANAPGTIDADYRDEVGVIIENTSLDIDYIVTELKSRFENLVLGEYSPQPIYPVNKKDPGFKKNANGAYLIRKGERIAQLVFNQVMEVELEEVKSVAEIGSSRGGGFGSTGV